MNSWDNVLNLINENNDKWLDETESSHPLWKNKFLNYVCSK